MHNGDGYLPRITLEDAAAGKSGRLNRDDAAKFLGVSPSTLADWQRRGLGPASVKVGGLRFYRVKALTDFIEKGNC